MEFSEHIQRHKRGTILSLSRLLSHPFSTMSNPSSWAVQIEVKHGAATSKYVLQYL